MTTLIYGYVPRDFYNLELRHHQTLFIAFMCLVLFIYGCKITLFLLICKLFRTFFCLLIEKVLKNLHFIAELSIFAADKPFETIAQDLSHIVRGW